MLELPQKLIAFKYSCKLSYRKAANYAEHLLYELLQEDQDERGDNFAEQYFMTGKKTVQLTRRTFKIGKESLL
ncbi:MAG: hypothetical protein LBH01_02285 [Verrucomicrobiales bacterium]|jgi:hypothetical protein|nr:hypothetical protein [Verrucomicrobiales bacterium]